MVGEASDSVKTLDESAMSREGQIVRASIIGIIANVLLAAAKAVIGVLANSIAIIMDAVNNTTDAASSIVTLVGTKLASKKPDRKHPYGHGRIEYITTIIIAAVIVWAGVTSLVESVGHIIDPELADYNPVSLFVIVIAVAVKVILGLYTRSVGKRAKSGALVASGIDALMDAVISAATLVAAVVYIALGISLEAWLATIISIVIIKAGYDMLQEVLSKIIGERVDPKQTKAIKETVRQCDGVLGAYDLMLEDHGPDQLWGSVHVEVPDVYNAAKIDHITRDIQKRVFDEHNVLLHTVGIYSVNTNNDEAVRIRQDVLDLAAANGHIIEVHGFYLDEETKHVNFDLVVSFDIQKRHECADRIQSIMESRYPDYTFTATLDSDISD